MTKAVAGFFTMVGRGRLGARIGAALEQRGASLQWARLDRDAGLQLDLPAEYHEPHTTSRIASLLICISAHQPWPELLAGLQRQIQSGVVSIGRVYFISSCAVYRGLQQGFIHHDTPTPDADDHVRALLQAEQLVRGLSAHNTVMRLPGLTGPGYERYQPLLMAQERSRHAVDIRALAEVIAERLLQTSAATEAAMARTELLTDGKVYWQGRAYDLRADADVVRELAQTQCVYRPSMLAAWGQHIRSDFSIQSALKQPPLAPP